MNRQTRADTFARELESLLAGRNQKAHPEFRGLLEVAADLRQLASPEFKSRLKSDLLEEIGSLEPPKADCEQAAGGALFFEALPIVGGDPHIFPAGQRSFLASFLSHTALIAIIASGIWGGRVAMVRGRAPHSRLTYLATGDGGGGSGAGGRLAAAAGAPPKLTERRLVPATIVVRRQVRLPVERTAVGPPDIQLPPPETIGDLVFPHLAGPSNGTGTGGGAGQGTQTGFGAGAGFGPGSERGAGGVLAPRPVYDPEPEYPEEARKLRLQGTVLLSLVVDEQGRARDIRIERPLGMGLDEKAVEAVKNWKFIPATRDGIAVAAEITVEVSFRLY